VVRLADGWLYHPTSLEALHAEVDSDKLAWAPRAVAAAKRRFYVINCAVSCLDYWALLHRWAVLEVHKSLSVSNPIRSRSDCAQSSIHGPGERLTEYISTHPRNRNSKYRGFFNMAEGHCNCASISVSIPELPETSIVCYWYTTNTTERHLLQPLILSAPTADVQVLRLDH